MYWLVLLDDYSASFGLMVVVITTCLAVTRVYGKKRSGSWSRDFPTWENGVYLEVPLSDARGHWEKDFHKPTGILPPHRHSEVLPRHPHDAGLQAGPLLQGLLAISVPSHTPGKQGGVAVADWFSSVLSLIRPPWQRGEPLPGLQAGGEGPSLHLSPFPGSPAFEAVLGQSCLRLARRWGFPD